MHISTLVTKLSMCTLPVNNQFKIILVLLLFICLKFFFFRYYDNILTDELNNLTKTLLAAVVQLQQKLYKRDPIKGASKKRYVVGFHEVRKHLMLNKVKLVIIPPNLRILDSNGIYLLNISIVI